MKKGLQETYAPSSSCFGCGPNNPHGLRIQSIPDGAEVTATWSPQPHHEAFPGVLSGGIIGCLLDCHSNWTAAFEIMKRNKLDQPLCTVTAEYTVKLLRPTPTMGVVQLRACAKEVTAERAIIEAELIAGGKTCATCVGTFVAVKPGHPAYHRW